MVDQARLRLEQRFLSVEDDGAYGFVVICGLYPKTEDYYYGVIAREFETREQAEQYVAEYGSDKHVAELQAMLEMDKRAMARSLTVDKLLGRDIDI